MRAYQLERIFSGERIPRAFPWLNILGNGRNERVFHVGQFLAVGFDLARGGWKGALFGVLDLFLKRNPGKLGSHLQLSL